MPNGGTDCCKNCIFREITEEEKCSENYLDTFCKIRNKIITSPYYTYCANFHTHCTVAQGPIFIYGSYEEGDIRIPLYKDNKPIFGDSGICLICNNKFERGYEIQIRKEIKKFCSCEHYMIWWKEQNPKQLLLWDCSRDEKTWQEIHLQFYEEAIKLEPKNSYAWFKKGYLLGVLEHYEKSLECFDNVIKLEPNNSMGYNNKGINLEKIGKLEEAIEMYKKALKLDANNKLAFKNLQKLKRRLEN